MSDDQEASTPRMRSDVSLSDALWSGTQQVHYIRAGSDGPLMTASADDVSIMLLMDGHRTLAEIARDLGITDELRVLTLAHRMEASGLLAGSPRDTVVSPQAVEPHRARILVGGDGWLVRRVASSAPRTRSAVVGLILLLGVSGLVFSVALTSWLVYSTYEVAQAPLLLFAVAAVIWASLVPHELGHAAAAIHFGARVVGFGLFGRAPTYLPYCVVRDGVFIRGRARRALVALAGPAANLSVSVPLLMVWWALPDGPLRGAVAASVLGVVLASLMALLPLPGLDGLAALNHASASVDLHRDAQRYWCPRRIGPETRLPASRLRWFQLYVTLRTILVALLIASAASVVAVLAGAVWGIIVAAVLAVAVAVWWWRHSNRQSLPEGVMDEP